MVLSRKVGDKTTIEIGGRSMAFEIQRISGDKVRLAFDADADFHIVRNELVERDKAATAATEGQQS